MIAFAQNPVVSTQAKLKQDLAIYQVVAVGDPQVLYTVPAGSTVKGYGPSDLTMRLNRIGYLKKD